MESQRLHTLRAGRDGCPSDLLLDRLQAGELTSAQAQQLSVHIAQCDVCPSRMALRQEGFAAFPALDTRPLLSAIVRRVGEAQDVQDRRRSLSKLLAWCAPIGAVAALLMLVLRGSFPTTTPANDPSGTREKGGAILHVFRQVGESAREAQSGDFFSPGDRLRFVIDLPARAQIRVIGIEPSGALYVAWPQDRAVSTIFAAGRGLALPGAVALDEGVGKETLYLVSCPPSQDDPDTLCTSAGAESAPKCRSGCALSSFVLNKK